MKNTQKGNVVEQAKVRIEKNEAVTSNQLEMLEFGVNSEHTSNKQSSEN